MSEIAEDFNALKKDRQEKRAANRESSADLLVSSGISFDARNNGAHLIVHGIGHTFDFWPGTGLWSMRGSTQKHRGVRSLIKLINPKVKEITE